MFAYLAGITGAEIHFTTGICPPAAPPLRLCRSPSNRCRSSLPAADCASAWESAGTTSIRGARAGLPYFRGARQEEQIDLLRQLFTGSVVDFAGRFDRIDRASLVPKPARPIPILARWFRREGVRSGGRLADGFLFFGGGVDQPSTSWRQLRERVDDVGRPVGDFGGEYVALSGADVAHSYR